MSTFERLALSAYDDGPCPWPADVYRTALRAAYAEIDRLIADAGFFLRGQIEARAAANILGTKCKQLETERTLLTKDDVAGPHTLVTDRVAYAENRRLREENDNLKAEIDRLRASVPDWHVVTDDPRTLPDDACVVLLMRRGPANNIWVRGIAEYSQRTDSWVLKSPVYNTPELTTSITPGDRWAYIPEVK